MSLNDVRATDSMRMRQVPALSAVAEPVASRFLKPFLRGFEIGILTVELPSGALIEHRGTQPGPQARLVLHRWRLIQRVLFGGDIGFAESFMDGDWSTPDLIALLDCFLRNETPMKKAWQGFSLARLLGRLHHAVHANTRRGSRRNIEAHYDLGNAFYAGWLDEGMNYSSALYKEPTQSLEAAQIAKLDRVISLLGVKPGDDVLEIGCGWGALSERLAARHSCNVTAITLSSEQLRYAEQRLATAGQADNARVRLQDYRDVTGTYDAIVSIEMLEAAGESYWPHYFKMLSERLRKGGAAVLQVITIEQRRFAEYRRRPDFIQRYIFPGGMLPTVDHIERHAAAAGLALCSVEMFGESYARTLAEWRRRYMRAKPPPLEAPHLQASQFRRMWQYYLTYCEAGFRAGALDVGLYRLTHA